MQGLSRDRCKSQLWAKRPSRSFTCASPPIVRIAQTSVSTTGGQLPFKESLLVEPPTNYPRKWRQSFGAWSLRDALWVTDERNSKKPSLPKLWSGLVLRLPPLTICLCVLFKWGVLKIRNPKTDSWCGGPLFWETPMPIWVIIKPPSGTTLNNSCPHGVC